MQTTNHSNDAKKVSGLSPAPSLYHGYGLNMHALFGNGPLFLLASLAALLMTIPVTYVVIRSLQGGWQKWGRLLDDRIPGLLLNTLSLTLTVTLLATIIGTSLAWLVHKSDLWGRKYWSWLLTIPLLIPPYVGAISYIALFSPSGWLASWLGRPLFSIYSFTGVALVLTLFTYPYVYLVVGSALRRLSSSLEETAQASGLNPRQIFWRVTLPLLRPAIGAGGILTALYVLADFGAVSMLRFNTFTAAIYYQMGSYDQAAAAILSVVLIVITMIFLRIESRHKHQQRFYQIKGALRQPRPAELGPMQIPAVLYVLFILSIAVVLPIGVLLHWALAGISQGAINSKFFLYVFNSAYVAGAAALVSLCFALPIAYLKARHSSRMSLLIDRLAHAGYVLPGVVVALGVVFMFNNLLPMLSGTAAVLILAYIIRFLPQNMQTLDTGFSNLSPRLEESALSLGYTPLQTLCKVTLPLIMPSALTGTALVFISALKELPATLLLRPAGLDTLTVRIWIEASEGFYQTAAPAALLLILLSIVPLHWMLTKQ